MTGALGTFRAAVEAGDIDAITRTLDPGIEFHSPVMVRPYHGVEEVTTLLRILLKTFEDFHYTHDLAGHALSGPALAGTEGAGAGAPGAKAQALVFGARVMGKAVQGLDLITFGATGLVTDLTVMVRPLPAAMTLARAVGGQLETAPPNGHDEGVRQ